MFTEFTSGFTFFNPQLLLSYGMWIQWNTLQRCDVHSFVRLNMSVCPAVTPAPKFYMIALSQMQL